MVIDNYVSASPGRVAADYILAIKIVIPVHQSQTEYKESVKFQRTGRERKTHARKKSPEARSRQMSAGGSFGGSRGARPVPPEKGVFPLDHMHECDLEKKDYLNCLKTTGHKSEQCRQFSKKYLECRMERNLMAKQDMSELGFAKESEAEASRAKDSKRIDK